jgi:hypothetical protein
MKRNVIFIRNALVILTRNLTSPFICNVLVVAFFKGLSLKIESNYSDISQAQPYMAVG